MSGPFIAERTHMKLSRALIGTIITLAAVSSAFAQNQGGAPGGGGFGAGGGGGGGFGAGGGGGGGVAAGGGNAGGDPNNPNLGRRGRRGNRNGGAGGGFGADPNQPPSDVQLKSQELSLALD